MRIGVPRETAPGERRVAVVPQTIEALQTAGWEVLVERDAGAAAGFDDAHMAAAGATMVDAAAAAAADVVLRVGPVTVDQVETLHSGAVLIAFLDPFVDTDLVLALARRGVTALSVEAVPRITLAQSMDALSSQATAAGYAAVLLAATTSTKFLPMLVTAAGTIPPARALILGVGVAGLQAIATAKRLGAQVYAYDIRPETKEQVHSLGARFVEAPTQAGDEGGYATQVAEETQQRQFEVLAPFVADADILVTTAQIPGRPAPLLVTTQMVQSMKPGAVVVDIAAGTGGNVEPSRPDETVVVGGATVLGPTNLASHVAADASRMYARNLVALLERVGRGDTDLVIDLDDEIVGGCCITHGGEVVHPRARSVLGLDDAGGTP
jgi:H+-translocating NAD(P) transhydrogenase subunit alpha